MKIFMVLSIQGHSNYQFIPLKVTRKKKLPNGLLKDLAQGDPHKLLRADLKKKYGIKEMDNGAHIVVQLIDKQLLSFETRIFPPRFQIKGHVD